MPDLQALHEEFGPRGLRVIGVSVDAAGSDDQVREFLDDYGITFSILRDPAERVATAFATQGVPVTVVIDPEGTVVWRRLGPVSREDPGLKEALERVGVASAE
jgi:peroxiredoxin